MKTVVIFNEFDLGMNLYLIEGDHRHLEGVVIDQCDGDEEKMEELNLLIHTEEGEKRHQPITCDQAAEEIRHGAFLTWCGFAP